MKKIAKGFGYLLVFLFFLILFLPKEYLYYKAEELLQKERIIIAKERVYDRGVSLKIEGGDLLIQGAKIGSFQSVVFYPDILFNAVITRHFAFVNLPIKLSLEHLTIVYTPLYPLKALIYGDGDFGKIEGSIDLKEHRVTIDIFSTKNLSALRSFIKLTKVSKGHYRYAYSY